MFNRLIGGAGFGDKLRRISRIIAILNLIHAALAVFLQGYERLYPQTIPVNEQQSKTSSNEPAGPTLTPDEV